MLVPVTLVIEAKDEFIDGQGRLPGAGEVQARLGDVLADQTKHDFELPWRIVSVREGTP
jgi:hypothetical protein